MVTFLCVFLTSLLCFVSLILVIIGGVKKMNKLLYGGVAGFFVFGIATALIIISSTVGFFQDLSSDKIAETVEEVSENGGKIAGKAVKGSISGMSNSIGSELVTADSSVIEAGIVVNHCENLVGNRVSIYLDFTKDFDGVLTLYAYDSEDKKQGLAKESVQVKAGDEGTYSFDFGEGLNSGFSGYYKLIANTLQ
ncbi:MAG: hypothetical protein IKN77_08210 [Paludibacteraceae bacterium]|nr:hypothetical protein [Paludibacteraceae bacterium]